MTQTRNALHKPQDVPLLGVDPQAPRQRRSRAASIAALMSLGLALTIAVPRYRVVEDSAPPPERGTIPAAAPLIDWQTPHDAPPPLLPATLVGFDGGFGAVAEPAADRSAAWIGDATGTTWARLELPASPTGLASYGSGLIGFRNRTLWSIEPNPGGGSRIDELLELPDLARLGYGSGRSAIVAIDDDHILLQSPEGEVWHGDPVHGYQLVIRRGTWSLNIRDPWEAATRAQPPGACRPPAVGAVDYVPIISVDGGLVALVSGSATSPHGRWPQCEPRVWTSVDGRDWQPGGAGSGFPPTTYIYDAAARDGALMAVGGSGPGVPGMYTSPDGLRWTRTVTRGLPGFDEYQPVRITAGPAGWIVLARQVNAPDTTGWVSVDGECWETLPAYLEPRAAAVGATRFVVATTTGRIWTGSPTGQCR